MNTESVVSSTSMSAGHTSMKPMYTLYTQFPVRKVRWRPEFPTELAIISYSEAGIAGPGSSNTPAILSESSMSSSPDKISHLTAASHAFEDVPVKMSDLGHSKTNNLKIYGDSIELWDVRRAWIAKWVAEKAHADGGVSGTAFFFRITCGQSIFNFCFRYGFWRFANTLGTAAIRHIFSSRSLLR